MTEAFLSDLVVDFLEPLSTTRSSYTSSRIAVLRDGSTCPVLTLLAARKFGTWEREFFPFWVDGDSTNETLENVDLAQRIPRVRRKLDIPKGPGYRKAWRALNRVRVRQYSRDATTRRILRKQLEEILK